MAGGDLPPENKNTGGTLDMERIKELARAIVFALVGYRPQHVTPEMWDREYRDGQWEYLRKMDSIAGLVSILGYCDFLKPASILDAGCGEGLLAAMKGQIFESPRGPMFIDAQTRDVVHNIYIRKVEKVNGQLYNQEFETLKDVKDPGKTK